MSRPGTSVDVRGLQQVFADVMYDRREVPQKWEEVFSSFLSVFTTVLACRGVQDIEGLRRMYDRWLYEDIDLPGELDLPLDLLLELCVEGHELVRSLGSAQRTRLARYLLSDVLITEQLFFSCARSLHNPARPRPWEELRSQLSGTGSGIRVRRGLVFFLMRAALYAKSAASHFLSHAGRIIAAHKAAAITAGALALGGGGFLALQHSPLARVEPRSRSAVPRASAAAPARELRWHFYPGMSVNLVKEGRVSVFENGQLAEVRDERNIVNFIIDATNARGAACRGVFKTFHRTMESTVHHLVHSYESQFAVYYHGPYVVPYEMIQPSIRSIPTFPQKPVAPGDRWVAACEFLYHELTTPFELITNASYRYLRDEVLDGRSLAVLEISYVFDEDVAAQLGTRAVHELRYLRASNHSMLWWDSAAGVPFRQLDSFVEKASFHNGSVRSFSMSFTNSYDITSPISEKELAAVERRVSDVLAPYEDSRVWRDEQGVHIDLGTVFFEYDSAVLNRETRAALSEIGDLFAAYPDYEITVAGHTDNIGSARYNQELSEKRARAVAAYMIDRHPAFSDKLYTVGFGETRPAADNTTERGRQQNRRVSILLKQSGR